MYRQGLQLLGARGWRRVDEADSVIINNDNDNNDNRYMRKIQSNKPGNER